MAGSAAPLFGTFAPSVQTVVFTLSAEGMERANPKGSRRQAGLAAEPEKPRQRDPPIRKQQTAESRNF